MSMLLNMMGRRRDIQDKPEQGVNVWLEHLDPEALAVLEAFLIRPSGRLDPAHVAVRAHLAPSAARRGLQLLMEAGGIVNVSKPGERPSYRLAVTPAAI